jgi:hypothetical protein
VKKQYIIAFNIKIEKSIKIVSSESGFGTHFQNELKRNTEWKRNNTTKKYIQGKLFRVVSLLGYDVSQEKLLQLQG